MNKQEQFNKILTKYTFTFSTLKLSKEFLLGWFDFFQDDDLQEFEEALRRTILKSNTGFFPAVGQVQEELSRIYAIKNYRPPVYFKALPEPEIPEEIREANKTLLRKLIKDLGNKKKMSKKLNTKRIK